MRLRGGWPSDRPVLFLGGPWHGRLHATWVLPEVYRVGYWSRDGDGCYRPGYMKIADYHLCWFTPFSVAPSVRLGWGRPVFPVYVFPTYYGPARWR